MVIDFHTHIFPVKIAEKALPHLAKVAGGVTPCGKATAQSMLSVMDEQGVDKAVILNIATNPHQQKSVNDFAISFVGNDRIIPFGSVHPDSDDALNELDRLKQAGIKGVKLHPDYQQFFVDEERMFPIYEKIAELGLITVFHSGVDIGYPDPVHCTPEKLSRILVRFGNAPVIAAHLGGYLMYEQTLEYLSDSGIYIDTSFSYGTVPPDYAKTIVSSIGEDRVLFGTDMPWSSPVNELNYIDSLGLSDEALKKIKYLNAQKLLKI